MLIKTTRRRFLGALGTATFAASTLRFFLKTAEAQTYPKRFVFVFTPNGADGMAASSGLGKDYVLGPDMSIFNELKHKFTVLDGLQIPDHGGEEHPAGRCSMLSSWRSSGTQSTAGNRGQSFDIFLRAKLPGVNGNSIYTGTEGLDDTLELPISWLSAGVRNDSYLQGLGPLIGRVFQNAPVVPSPMATNSAMSAATADELALNDYLRGEVERLRAEAPLAEFAKLDLHLQALSQLRAGLVPASGDPGTALRMCDSNPTFTGDVADQMGLALAHGLACGQTRVAVFRIGSYEPNHVHSHWEEGGMDGVNGFRDEFRRINRGWAQNILNFLKALDSFPEGNGTLLDNTAVVWSSELSNHYRSESYLRNYPNWAYPAKAGDVNTHGTVDMPFWLAGSLGGTLKQGERIVAQDRYAGELYKAIATAMGVSSTDLSSYGEPAFAPGILQEILA
ncbi:MAG: DUF1552 domain-containing protein [Polyangiaceae bacterium]|nr:DUF1552 domain-containing protein [Polyangiaceae bacterium]